MNTYDELQECIERLEYQLGYCREVLDLIPPCPEHGSDCLPHQTNWINNKREAVDFNDYTLSAWRTFANTQSVFREQIMLSALGLAGESGEYVDIIKKLCFHGHTIDMHKVQEELGDILWYLAIACKVWGFSFSEIAASNRRKLEERYPLGFDPQRSAVRSTGEE